MSVKRYGIYLFYPPTVDLRSEGLGRHLAEFLKGAQERDVIRFVVACPSWTRDSLQQLCSDAGVDPQSFDIVSPHNKPLILKSYELYHKMKKKSIRRGKISKLVRRLRNSLDDFFDLMLKKLVGIRSLILGVFLGTLMLPFLAMFALFRCISIGISKIFLLGRKISLRILKNSKIQKFKVKQEKALGEPKNDSRLLKLYNFMEETESAALRKLIERRIDVIAWYCPTSFWPHFNNITAPRIMCVPDVVLADFPVGFAGVGGERLLLNFNQVDKAIRGGEFYVTYSHHVKWHTLVKRYNVDPDAVYVVPHGANRLDELVMVSDTPFNDSATDELCRNLFRSALTKAANHPDASIYGIGDVRFIFYASQFRPNKNVISLLRAYNYLLKRRYISLKLILTGKPTPEIQSFINDNNLEHDVLCLHGLTAQELAACYRLADLSVNPSLSEGGCPFTFSEAISVGTPVVMSRIPVTEEVIVDSELQSFMLFDPYDYKDIANRIEWALDNKEELYKIQRSFFDEVVAKRTWRDVVEEYINVLDDIVDSSRRKS